MPGVTSSTKGEEKALAGDNESQDSQIIFDMYQRMYGIGERSSSPLRDDQPTTSSSPPQDDEVPFHVLNQQARIYNHASQSGRKDLQYGTGRGPHQIKAASVSLPLSETRYATFNDREPEPARSLSSDNFPPARYSDDKRALTAPGPGTRREKATVDIPGHDNREQCAPNDPEPSVANVLDVRESRVANRKMDPSQSPTQSNDGRSYDRYFHASAHSEKAVAHLEEPAQQVDGTTQSSVYEQRSLLEDDTGVVVFDIDNPAGPSIGTSLPSELSPQSAYASVRARTFTLQQHTSQEQEQAPETPALRNNPFAGNNNFQLLPTSQLFKATQFSSGFRRGASPTSSRPSPNDFPHHAISPNPISSPLKARGLRTSPIAEETSSPHLIRTTDSPALGDEQTRPSNTDSDEEEPVVPESPQYPAPKARPVVAPMDVYVPMRQSQERRSSSLVPPDAGSPELSDDGDDPIDRRRRARSKKEASLRRLTSIQFTRTPESEDVEVPSTSTKKRKSRTAAQEYIAQCHGSPVLGGDSESQDRVENSQELPIAQTAGSGDSTQSSQREEAVSEVAIARSSAADGQPSPKRQRLINLPRLDSTETTETNVAKRETIPETSPIDKAPKHTFDTLRPSHVDGEKPSSNTVVVGSPRHADGTTCAPESSVTDFVPPTMTSARSMDRPSLDSPDVMSSVRQHLFSEAGEASSPSLPQLPRDEPIAHESSPPAPALSTRSKTRQHHDLQVEHVETEKAVPSSKELPDPLTSMSTLTTLSATPSLTMSTTTPGSQGSAASGNLRAVDGGTANSSPAVAQAKRRRVGDLPRLKTAPTTQSLRASTRLSRQHKQLGSTDELAKSPSKTPTFEHSVRGQSRTSLARSMRVSTTDIQHFHHLSSRQPGKPFSGMAFAVSMKPGERERLEKKIVQAGGRVLDDGFAELLKSNPERSVTASPMSSAPSSPPQAGDGDVALTPTASHLGFTALIADGHSRKEKYLQALALGLPCIAANWITTCLDNGAVVDWAPYLLCSGQSAVLGGAYMSRNLAPYDAAQARLAHVIEARPRLLDENRILVLMKKSEQKSEQGKKMMSYILLARILGATLCRAHSADDARQMLKESQDTGRPFHWVYTCGEVDTRQLFTDAGAAAAAAAAGANSKKRKRGGRGSAVAGALNRPRTLTSELVVQSLIMGRLVQEGEMEG